MKTPRFRLVHLDFDGTLVDSREDLAASTNHVRRSFGLDPLDPRDVHKLVGRGARVLVERALGSERKELHEEAIRLFLAHYGDHCLDRTRAHPGMERLLDQLGAAGVAFSVVTNKPEALTRKILEGLGLHSRFLAVVGGDTFPEKKPDPRGVENVRSRAGASRDESLMVGDSIVDVETARAAGIACCGVLWGLDPEGVAGADFVVESAGELARVIRG